MHKKTGAVIAALFTTILLAGCGTVDGTQPAITVNNETMSLGTATLDLRYQQAQSTAAMSMYGMSATGGGIWDMAISTDEDGNSTTYGDMTKESVQNSIVNMLLLKQHAADYGVEIPEHVITEAATVAKTVFEKNKEVLAPAGVTEDNVRELLTMSAYSSILYDPMTADVDTEVTDEEAQQSTITYARILQSTAETETAEEGEGTEEETAETEETEETAETTEETGEAEPDTSENRALMEDLLEKLQAESDPAAADLEALAKEISEDIFVYTYSYGKEDSYMAEEVIDAAAGLKDGEVYDGVIETEDGYFYLVRMDAVFDEEATELEKTSIAESRKQEAYYDLLEKWTEEAEITTSKAWDELQLNDSEPWTIKTS